MPNNHDQSTDDRYRAGQLAMMHRAALAVIQLWGAVATFVVAWLFVVGWLVGVVHV